MDNNSENIQELTGFDIKKFYKLCVHRWYWFLVCIIFSVGIALFYIYTREPKYERYEQILVNEQESNGGLDDISNAFSTLGLFSKNTNVYNELITMISPALMYQVADSLQLDMNYMVREGLKYQTLYGKNLPFIIKLLDIDTQEAASFRIKFADSGAMELDKFVKILPDGKIKYKEKVIFQKEETEMNTPIGKIKITPNPVFLPGKKSIKELQVSKFPMQETVEDYCKMLKGDLVDQDADVIELVIEDVSVQRAVDILNCILIFYNRDWVKDKNRMAVATSAFIDERLKVIKSELGDVDRNIADYMKQTKTPDLETAIQMNMELGSRVEEQLIKTNNELSVAKYMQDFLNQNDNIDTILPVNLGLEGVQLNSQIVSYNELILARNNILNNSSLSNPLVQNYNSQLHSMRQAIEKSVNNLVANLQGSVNNLRKEIAAKTSELSNVPEDNLPLLSEERQQAVKEALYLFLLQKREENELSQKFSADNIRIITPPVGSLKPVSPKKGLIIVIAGIIGIGVPILLIYFLELLNTTVRNKDDLHTLLVPFAGEIPQIGKKVNLRKLSAKNPLQRTKEEKPPLTVVESGKRDVANEAFRVIRGNLDFMNGKSNSPQVLMLTSFNPGSGKSFVTYNLALSYSLKNKKVLIIDCDLRHGSASMYVGSPSAGLSDFLANDNEDWKRYIVNNDNNPNLSILPIGKIPPNPAELLENGKLELLIDEAKSVYDIIILDCPPVNIVVDTQLVAQYADRTIFVIRAGLLERAALKELNEFYKEKKYKNLCVILNGTEAMHSRYYTYGNYQYLN